MLDSDRALVLAGTAGRALPEHLLRVDARQPRLPWAVEKRVLCLQDERLRVELLPRAPRRAVDLAASALDACKRVEHRLAAEILHRLEPDLLLVEVEVWDVAELWRPQQDGDRRKHEVHVLRCRNERQKRQDHQRVDPPVDAPRRRDLVQAPRQEERHHQRRDQEPDHDRLDRHARPERDRPHDGPPNQQVDDTAQNCDGERRENDSIRAEDGRAGDVHQAEPREEFRGGIAAEGDEAPEHERVGEAGHRALADGTALQDDVSDKPCCPGCGPIQRKRLPRREDQAYREWPPGRRTRRQRPERGSTGHRRQQLYSFNALISAGTTSNRSPTIPKSATSKIGASGSLLTATMTPEPFMPTRC